MNEALENKLSLACWIGQQLYTRHMGPGTTGNLSFLHENTLYITRSGVCFGQLTPADFSAVNLADGSIEGPKPSKELPIHQLAYDQRPDITAVLHVHSTYAVLWSVLPHENPADCIPAYTPYLEMKLGTVGLIDFGMPGSNELVEAFKKQAPLSDGWILKNHGPLIGGKTLMDAFACLEELEESCRLAWELKDLPQAAKIR